MDGEQTTLLGLVACLGTRNRETRTTVLVVLYYYYIALRFHSSFNSCTMIAVPTGPSSSKNDLPRIVVEVAWRTVETSVNLISVLPRKLIDTSPSSSEAFSNNEILRIWSPISTSLNCQRSLGHLGQNE